MGMDRARLGAATSSSIEDRGNDLFLSIASIWELGIKDEIGKLRLPQEFQGYVRTRLVKSEAAVLNLSPEHLFELKGIDAHHRDPFDRILVAQARVESMTLVTADERLLKYSVQTLDART